MALPYLLLYDEAAVLPPDAGETLMSMTFVSPGSVTVDTIEFTPVSMVVMDANGDVEDILSLTETPPSFSVPSTVLADGQMVMIMGRVTLR